MPVSDPDPCLSICWQASEISRLTAAPDVWFAYYKDMRKQGGRLKMGYGPGGPPVFSAEEVLDLVGTDGQAWLP